MVEQSPEIILACEEKATTHKGLYQKYSLVLGTVHVLNSNAPPPDRHSTSLLCTPFFVLFLWPLDLCRETVL